jgi:hypothetical protein
MIKHALLFSVLFIFTNLSLAVTVNTKLFIVSDSLETVGGAKFPYRTFNETSVFNKTNTRIELNVFDSLSLWVVNKDSIAHNFNIIGFNGLLQSIPSNDSVLIGVKFSTVGNYIYHDPLDFPSQTYLGLAGMIVVKNDTHASFYWNIKEHDSTWNSELVNNNTVDWTTYDPKYFTINGNSNPNINLDTDARITGNIGDTIIVYIANTGQSIHSMHFHGYHATILFSSKNQSHVGRSKDTFPLYSMETVILQIVPDKSGEYPVHDHNLVAITANNVYPNGMFTTLLINP